VLTVGSRLGTYEILRPLGSGGMGEVYLAHDARLDREVALKLLPRGVSNDLAAIASFRREALTLASLTHPNIATVHGFEETPDGLLVLVLERVEGETLADRLRRGELGLNDSLQICAQIAQALEAAHERGVIHRDVKPGNVMIGARGLVKVLDFGIARRASASPDAPTVPTAVPTSDEPAATIALATGGTEPGMVQGTPGYMSPEQVLGSAVDERSDVFAFGCVLYECLAGRRAFSGGTAVEVLSAVLHRPADLAALPASTPARVRTLVARCLERTASQRLPSMRAARVELEEVLGIRRASALREGEGFSTPHNLPAQTTSFVGRAALLGECRGLFASSRLMTLAGIGGSGKTRLALQLATSLLGKFPDGVWFVNLAQLADAERVPDVAAAALGVPDEPGRTSLESLTAHVRDRQMLPFGGALEKAVLDLQADERGPAVPGGEGVRNQPPGARGAGRDRARGSTARGSAAGAIAGVESLRGFEAVELFLDRARAAQPQFELDSANAEAVAEICRRLDGIPLALELAAGRMRVLSAQQIRDRLDDRFRLLARPGSDPPSRRQTVKAVIQWSWDHLLPPEQDLMRRLAVFTGGWTLERAATVCAACGDEFEVLDLLTRLVEHSLVVVDRAPSGEARYRFLESVWQFALEQFEASAERLDLRERHLALYLDLAEQSEPALAGAAAAAQVAVLVPEEENLLAALAFTAHAEDGARRGLRLVTSAQRFWSMLGRYALARRAFAMPRSPTRTRRCQVRSEPGRSCAGPA
jgi:non-specific serine/threonine protein kinase